MTGSQKTDCRCEILLVKGLGLQACPSVFFEGYMACQFALKANRDNLHLASGVLIPGLSVLLRGLLAGAVVVSAGTAIATPLPTTLPLLLSEAIDFVAEGKRLLVERDFPGAERAFRQALQSHPKDAKSHNNLGHALAQQGKLEPAIASFRRALQLNPELAEAHYNLGFALAQQGKQLAAIAAFRQAVRLNPEDPDGHYYLGVVLGQQGRNGEAITAYRRTIELDASYAEAYGNLGVSLLQQGRRAEAVTALKQAKEQFLKQGKTQDATRAERYIQQIEGQ